MKSFARVQSFVLVLATAVAVLGPLGRGAAQAQAAPQAAVEVWISMFSGRVDPHFELPEGKELDELRARLASAPRLVDPPRQGVIGGMFGYRGIEVRVRGEVSGLPARIAVFNQAIQLASADQRDFFVDQDRALERYLLDLALAYEAIDERLHVSLVARLASPPLPAAPSSSAPLVPQPVP